jgi:putative transposase
MATSLPEVTDAMWEEACRREDVVRALIERYPGSLSKTTIAEACRHLDVSRSSLYRMLRRLKAEGTVTALLPHTRGRHEGSKIDDPSRDRHIRQTIKQFYLTPERPKFARLVEKIRLRCIEEGLVAPSWRTVKARLREIDARIGAQRRGDKRTIAATKAVPGQYRASRPLEIVQIDHTRVDVIVVDEETRKPIGRPWLTLAMDIFSRMVTGFYLTMDPPSLLSISLCLLHATYDKTAWLKDRMIEGDWPIAGLPETIHVDNGADFRSRAFERACRNEGIRLIWRDPG